MSVNLKLIVDGIRRTTEFRHTRISVSRGSAFQRFTAEPTNEPDILHNYDSFVDRVLSTLDYPKQQLLPNRHESNQKASVQLYALEFKQLSAQLPDSTAAAQFVKGLKSHIREAPIVNEEDDDLDSHIKEAQRIDSQLYSSKRGGTIKKNGSGEHKGSPGKFHSCGQFGHGARD